MKTKKIKYKLIIDVEQPNIGTTVIKRLNGKKVRHRLLDKFLWEICDMHRHNSNQYPEEKPTIASALREVLDEGATHTFQN